MLVGPVPQRIDDTEPRGVGLSVEMPIGRESIADHSDTQRTRASLRQSPKSQIGTFKSRTSHVASLRILRRLLPWYSTGLEARTGLTR